ADANGISTCNTTASTPNTFPQTGGSIVVVVGPGTPTVTPSSTVTPSPTATPSPTVTPTPTVPALPVTGNGTCAVLIGADCIVTATLTGTGNVTGSMSWTLTVPTGLIPAGTAATVFIPTTGGIASFTCPLAVAGAVTICTGTTPGNGLEGGIISVFAGGATAVATGQIHGAP